MNESRTSTPASEAASTRSLSSAVRRGAYAVPGAPVIVKGPKSVAYVSIGGQFVATTRSSSPQRSSASTPGGWIEVGRGRVARERRAVDCQNSTTLACEQHRGRRAGAARSHHDRVVCLRHGSSSVECLSPRLGGESRRRFGRTTQLVGRRMGTSEQVLLVRVRGRRCARGDAELRVDVADMPVDSPFAQDELGCNCPVRPAGRDQAQHLELARTQPVRVSAEPRKSSTSGPGRRRCSPRAPRRRRAQPRAPARRCRDRRVPRRRALRERVPSRTRKAPRARATAATSGAVPTERQRSRLERAKRLLARRPTSRVVRHCPARPRQL